MNNKYNVSTSPHVRSSLTTGHVMYDVILCLMPATVMGLWHFRLQAFLVIATSIVSAMLTEFVFDFVTNKENTVKDGSAIVTGLLLGLCLPASVPLYIPYIGALFAILVVKCLFGGLGKNFMNPALAGRCFLLISFSSIVTNFAVDGYSSATPLAQMAAGEAVSVTQMLIGNTSGVIGNSVIALFIGGIILWAMGGITFEIPVSIVVTFALFVALFGGQGFDPVFILAHLAGGGLIMGALFMATDPVTSPVTSGGQVLYGILIGLMCGVFRIFSSAADSVSYAILIGNMAAPLIEEITVPVPYGLRDQKKLKPAKAAAAEPAAEAAPAAAKEEAPAGQAAGTAGKKPEAKKSGFPIPHAALVLTAITIIAGVALSGVYQMTKDTIDAQKMAASAASYQAVVPDATSFSFDDGLTAAVNALGGEVYGTDFGRAYINDMVVGKDDSGNVVGYVISATSSDGYDGNITVSVGFSPDGTVNGISFTELNETAGMGMLCAEDAFRTQFDNVKTDAFVLNKAGGSTADNEIDSVSGASTSSGAVVNAVNAAIDFFKANVG